MFKNTNVILQLKNVSFLSHKNIDWSLLRGHIHAIVGSSGVGKSCFLKLFLGCMPFSGMILDYQNEMWDYKKHNIAVQFQNSALLSHLSIGANIYLPLSMKYDLPIECAEMIAYGYMQKVGLNAVDFYKLPIECSGGMQKRASLARALILNPEILFLDEPTSGLDVQSSILYDELLLQLRNMYNMSIVMVSHDLERVRAIADMVTIITKEGVFTDTFDNLSKHDNLAIREFLRVHG